MRSMKNERTARLAREEYNEEERYGVLRFVS